MPLWAPQPLCTGQASHILLTPVQFFPLALLLSKSFCLEMEQLWQGNVDGSRAKLELTAPFMRGQESGQHLRVLWLRVHQAQAPQRCRRTVCLKTVLAEMWKGLACLREATVRYFAKASFNPEYIILSLSLSAHASEAFSASVLLLPAPSCHFSKHKAPIGPPSPPFEIQAQTLSSSGWFKYKRNATHTSRCL